MGLGDEIMVTALVKKARRASPIPCAIVNSQDKLRWNDAWLNNPFILNSEKLKGRHASELNQNFTKIASGEGVLRHYIAHAEGHKFYKWKEWDIEPGQIFFSIFEREAIAQLKEAAKGLPKNGKVILIEPCIKTNLQINKRWLWRNWEKLVQLLEDANYNVFQLKHRYTTSIVDGAEPFPIHSIRQFLAAIAACDGFVSIESGFHHAAAAFKIPGVVIFGGFIPPSVTGYKDIHENLTFAKEFCGNMIPCMHCVEEMTKITPEVVFEAFRISQKKAEENPI